MKARLDHPDPPDGELDGFAWPLRFTDFDVLGHVNNAACWQIVEEALAERRDLRAPLRAEVQHRTAIERDADVDGADAQRRRRRCRLWVVADGAVARDRAAVAADGLLDERVVEEARRRRGW